MIINSKDLFIDLYKCKKPVMEYLVYECNIPLLSYEGGFYYFADSEKLKYCRREMPISVKIRELFAK